MYVYLYIYIYIYIYIHTRTHVYRILRVCASLSIKRHWQILGSPPKPPFSLNILSPNPKPQQTLGPKP